MMFAVYDDLESLSRAAAKIVLARPRKSLVLSGGSTPRRLYELLAEHQELRDVDFFWGDERPVPPNHRDSNYRMAREAMLDKLGATRVHRIEAERPDRDAVAREYEADLRRVGLDLVLLGMGADGHTASLFPGTAALLETERWVVPNLGCSQRNQSAMIPSSAIRLRMPLPPTREVFTAPRHPLTTALVGAVSRITGRA